MEDARFNAVEASERSHARRRLAKGQSASKIAIRIRRRIVGGTLVGEAVDAGSEGAFEEAKAL